VIHSTLHRGVLTLASTLGRSAEGGFDRRLVKLRKLGLIDRGKARVRATEAGRERWLFDARAVMR
jgi:hypothetical protein